MDRQAVKRILRGPNQDDKLKRMATYASSGVAIVLIVTKLGAWFMSDSVALLSSLIDSTLDLLASLVTLMAVRHAMMPADREHRFGHGKAEPLAALAQSGFIGGSAMLLLFEASSRLIDPKPVAQTDIAIAVMVLSIILTLALVAFQTYVTKRAKSVAIDADAMHYKSDLAANLGVIATLIAAGYFNLPILDPIFGFLVAVYIAKGAWNVGTDAYQMLMDRELPDEDREKIRNIALSYKETLGVHDLRTRRSGPDIFIQMHIDFNGTLSLNRVHSVADAVEREVMDEFPGSEVIVHQDPVVHYEKAGPRADLPEGPAADSSGEDDEARGETA